MLIELQQRRYSDSLPRGIKGVNMNLLIAGASGFIGHHLVNVLQLTHKITVVGRNKERLEKRFPQKKIKTCTWEKLADLDANSYDAIINLCGYSIGASRWTEKVKRLLIDSRVNTTTDLIKWAIKHNAKPHFYCANAVGIYGTQKNGDPQAFDETSALNFDHPDFLSEIGIRWQSALQSAVDFGMPVTTTRFGVVLKKGEGMLKKLGPSFYVGLGAIIGDGKQILSWVHVDDIVGAYLFLLDHPEMTGAFNLTAPIPVSQKQFARTLAKAMHRPLFLKMPAFVVKTLFGEMGEYLLLKGQRVVPKRLVEAGYQFHYPELTTALTLEFQ